VLHVGVEGEAEGDDLDQRREEHEEQGRRIPEHHDELLVEHRPEALEHAFHEMATKNTTSTIISP
jgi:hypothetical protein